MEAGDPFVVKTLKEVGFSTKGVFVIALIAVGLYAYKTFLDTTLTKLNIKKAHRDLGDKDLKARFTEYLQKMGHSEKAIQEITSIPPPEIQYQ